MRPLQRGQRTEPRLRSNSAASGRALELGRLVQIRPGARLSDSANESATGLRSADP
jgi:hypothetical protein